MFFPHIPTPSPPATTSLTGAVRPVTRPAPLPLSRNYSPTDSACSAQTTPHTLGTRNNLAYWRNQALPES